MNNLENASSFEQKLAKLALDVKKNIKGSGTQKRLPENIWKEAVALTKHLSVSQVAMSIDVSRGSLYNKIKEQKPLKLRKSLKGKKSKSGFIEVTSLLNGKNQIKSLPQVFSNSSMDQKVVPPHCTSSATNLYMDLIRSDGTIMKIHGNSMQINLANLMSQFIRGDL